MKQILGQTKKNKNKNHKEKGEACPTGAPRLTAHARQCTAPLNPHPRCSLPFSMFLLLWFGGKEKQVKHKFSFISCLDAQERNYKKSSKSSKAVIDDRIVVSVWKQLEREMAG